MPRPFHIYLSSLHSKDRFPGNSGIDFRVQLSEDITLPRAEWSCGLVEVHLSTLPVQPVFVCSNICEENIVGENRLPVLACITEKDAVPSHVIYVRLKTNSIQSIHIYLTDCFGKKLTDPVSSLYCTLHFMKHEADWDSC